MFKLAYKRLIANVTDVRYFRNSYELSDWITMQSRLEPFEVLSLDFIDEES